ncbi:HipA N-terminal domain-containing protein [Pendulispora rubella]|uniref:HipA N-terminal domain-containing protein n=1 Tax=Pendulispora rubella TaxID=2741070 RepID=A0ABZ2LHC2_9BACT
MNGELLAWLDQRLVGHLRRDRRGKLTFVYADEWAGSPDAYPISLSMPLTMSEHRHAVVDAYIWGLLPDNELILERWARRFQVSPRNAFALLLHVGEDCAGAIRFATAERSAYLADEPGTIDWDIGPYQWDKLGAELKFDPDDLRARLRRMADALPDLVQMHLRRAHDEGLSHPVVAALAEAIAKRCVEVRFPRGT